MAGFVFRLASLKKLRESVRDERLAELAQAYQAERILAEQLEKLESDIHNLRELARKKAQPGEVNVDSLIGAHRHELLLDAERRECIERGKLVAAEIERRRQKVARADTDVKVLDRLEEKKLLQYQEKEEKKDSRFMDEIAGNRFRREIVL